MKAVSEEHALMALVWTRPWARQTSATSPGTSALQGRFHPPVHEVAAVLGVFASRPLELQGGVKDLEPVGEDFLDALDEGRTVNTLNVHDMGCEGVLAAGKHPDTLLSG